MAINNPNNCEAILHPRKSVKSVAKDSCEATAVFGINKYNFSSNCEAIPNPCKSLKSAAKNSCEATSV